MRKHTALSWATALEITEAEFDEYLIELGYQIPSISKQRWERTPKGLEHSRCFFGRIYWDIDAFFEVLKMKGKKSRTYFYCDECGAYNRISLEETELDSTYCSKCGYKMQFEN